MLPRRDAAIDELSTARTTRPRRSRPASIWLIGLVCALGPMSSFGRAAAQPVSGRIPEGATRGFLVMRSTDDRTVAHGELLSTVRGDRVDSRLTWRFLDGSLQDEMTSYVQKPVLKLLSYKQIQRGPAFPENVEVAFTREPGRWEMRRREKGKDEDETLSGTIELPADVYNGMTLAILKNLPRGATANGHMLAFTPKPRLVKMSIRPTGEDPVIVGETRRNATRYLVDLEVGGIAGIFAAVAGKEPPDLRYWLLGGDLPAFVKFEGSLFLNGPVWRIELTAPRWPK
jgi:hypothetical protein